MTSGGLHIIPISQYSTQSPYPAWNFSIYDEYYAVVFLNTTASVQEIIQSVMIVCLWTPVLHVAFGEGRAPETTVAKSMRSHEL